MMRNTAGRAALASAVIGGMAVALLAVSGAAWAGEVAIGSHRAPPGPGAAGPGWSPPGAQTGQGGRPTDHGSGRSHWGYGWNHPHHDGGPWGYWRDSGWRDSGWRDSGWRDSGWRYGGWGHGAWGPRVAPVYIPGQWIWTGWTWVWQPGYWR